MSRIFVLLVLTSIVAAGVAADESPSLVRDGDRLVFKANHCQWQWQFSCDIACDNPDDTASLRISTVPRP
jgi:hypothetical protein